MTSRPWPWLSTVALTALLAAIHGCGPKPEEPEPKPLVIGAGTPVRVALLQSLASGREREGASFRAMLMDDLVANDGTVVLPKGSPVPGTVLRSRGATAFTAVANQPARLVVRFGPIEVGSEKSIFLTGEKSDRDDGGFAFTRSNVGNVEPVKELEQGLDATQEATLDALREAIESGDPDRLKSLDREALAKLSESLGLTDLSRNARGDDLTKLVEGLVSGAGIVGGPLNLGVATQVLNLAGQAAKRVGGMLKGANIFAPVGTTVETFVLETVEVPPARR